MVDDSVPVQELPTRPTPAAAPSGGLFTDVPLTNSNHLM